MAQPAPSVSAAAAVAPVPAYGGAELGDDDLEQVVGGLERIYLPGRVVAD